MNANEAPKKIYLQQNTTTDCYGEWWPEWSEARAKDDDIEYIRTDAFIEKACDWLENSTYGYLTEKWGEVELDREALAEDFIKYMKGE